MQQKTSIIKNTVIMKVKIDNDEIHKWIVTKQV
ncbi:hypothetical protein CDLVIII_2727 [Clostridium sp. DL-VIII]|nr:hypothetical protein CDLVIII_2727 [Clostridium sp. DL-VIII]